MKRMARPTIGLPGPRLFGLIFIACAMLAGGCRSAPDFAVTSLKPASFVELQKDLLNGEADLDLFRLRGPFTVAVRRDYEIRLSATEGRAADLFLSGHGEKAPLVIIQHGFDSSKEEHAYQAMHLASWGMHSLSLQLPNKGPWVGNGRTLAKIAKLIHRRPDIFDHQVNVNRIILVGHSFGAAAAAVALGDGAPATGGILLDPAAIDRQVPGYLSRIKKPVLILGADERISRTRNREYFYRYVRSGVAEVSIKNALHADGQFPSESTEATEESQVTFMKAMTSAAFSLSSTGKFDYAWAGFGAAVKNGQFFNAKKK